MENRKVIKLGITSEMEKEEEGELEKGEWLDEEYEGQLSVDVFQTDKDIIIKSTIAGVRPEDIDISINDEQITIKGKRRQEHTVSEENYFYRECYWGGFSRSIILPQEIKPDQVEATMENGILTISLPKAEKVKVRKVRVKGN